MGARKPNVGGAVIKSSIYVDWTFVCKQFYFASKVSKGMANDIFNLKPCHGSKMFPKGGPRWISQKIFTPPYDHNFSKKTHRLKTQMNLRTCVKPYSCNKCELSFSQNLLVYKSTMYKTLLNLIFKFAPLIGRDGTKY